MTELNEFQRGAIRGTDCLSQAWEFVTAKLWLYVGAGLMVMIAFGCIPFAQSVLYGPLLAGFFIAAFRQMRGEDIEFGTFFKGFEKFGPLFLVGFLQMLPFTILQIVQYAANFITIFSGASRGSRYGNSLADSPMRGISPEIGQYLGATFLVIFAVIFIFVWIWTLAFYFAVPLVIDRGLKPIEAITTSARAAFSNIGGIIVVGLLALLVALLGVVALCVGLLVAYPVIFVMNACAYRMVFPELNSRLNYEPPAPDQYYGNFGQGV